MTMRQVRRVFYIGILLLVLIGAGFLGANYLSHRIIEQNGGITGLPGEMGFLSKLSPVYLIVVPSNGNSSNLSFLNKIPVTRYVRFLEIDSPGKTLAWNELPENIEELILTNAGQLSPEAVLSGCLEKFSNLNSAMFLGINWDKGVKDRIRSRYPSLRIDFFAKQSTSP